MGVVKYLFFTGVVADLKDCDSLDSVWYWAISDISSIIFVVVEDSGLNVLPRSTGCLFVVLNGNIPPLKASKTYFLPSKSNPEFL